MATTKIMKKVINTLTKETIYVGFSLDCSEKRDSLILSDEYNHIGLEVLRDTFKVVPHYSVTFLEWMN